MLEPYTANSLRYKEELKALAAELPPELDAYLKKIIDSALGKSKTSGLDVRHLLTALSSGRYTDAEFRETLGALNTTNKGSTPRARSCAWLIGVAALEPEHRHEAVEVLRGLLRTATSHLLSPAKGRMSRALAWPTSIAAILSSAFFWIGAQNDLTRFLTFASSTIFLSLLFYPVSLVILHQREVDDARELRFLAAHALGRLQMPEALDALSAASLEQSAYLPEMALISLRVLLTRLTPDHYGRLGAEVVPNLCHLLKRYAPISATDNDPNHILTVELLDALEKVGDARAIAPIQEVASARHPGRKRLRNIADRVVAVLEERKRRETERGTLLRGVTAPVANPAELLRGTVSQAESRPELLLRPIDQG